jgi:hypothetical protein
MDERNLILGGAKARDAELLDRERDCDRTSEM